MYKMFHYLSAEFHPPTPPPHVSPCGADQYMCVALNTGRDACFWDFTRCDGKQDCEDGQDEANCGTSSFRAQNTFFLHTCTGAGNIRNYLHQTNFTCTALNLETMDHTKIVEEPLLFFYT